MSYLRNLLGSLQETGRFREERPFEHLLRARGTDTKPYGWPHAHEAVPPAPAEPLKDLWRRRNGLGDYVHPSNYDRVLMEHCRIPEDWK